MKRLYGVSGLVSPFRYKPALLAACLFTTIAGLFCASLGIMAYCSAKDIFDGFLGPENGRIDYVVLGKKADSAAFFDPSRNEFGKDELRRMAKEPFVQKILPVLHTDVPVYLGISFAGKRLGTEIFFESVPSEVLGLDPATWKWQKGQPVPLLLPRSFLALFNMGFAASRGIPSIHEDMLSSIALNITVVSRQGTLEYAALISGLTERFSSFLVPAEFLEAINPSGHQNPRRLVLQVTNADAPEIEPFLERYNLEIHEGSSGLRQASMIASLVSIFFLILGLVLWFSSTIGYLQYLGSWMIQFAPTLETLVLLGFRKKKILTQFLRQTTFLQLAILVPSALSTALIRKLLHESIGTWLPGSTGITMIPYLLLPMLCIMQILLSTFMFHRKIIALTGTESTS